MVSQNTVPGPAVSVSITQELVSNANSQAPPQPKHILESQPLDLEVRAGN